MCKKKSKNTEIGSSNNFLINHLNKNNFRAYGFDFLTGRKLKIKSLILFC